MYCKEQENNLHEIFTWTRCTWKRMSDNATCRYKYHHAMNKNVFEIYDVCDGGLHGGLFFGSKMLFQGGENNICGINIPSVLETDGGQWMCKMEYYNMPSQPLNQCTTSAEIFVDVSILRIAYMIGYKFKNNICLY